MLKIKIQFIIKLLVAELLSINKLFRKKYTFQDFGERKDLKLHGISKINNFFTSKQIAILNEKIDALLENPQVNLWVDKQQCDHRIYFAENYLEELKPILYHDQTLEILKNEYGYTNPVGLAMIGHLVYKHGNVGSGGGWHRDSVFQNQIKTFCYLTKTSENNGPFALIKESHKWKNIFIAAVKHKINLKDSRISDSSLNQYMEKSNIKLTTFTGEAGDSFIANTRCIHGGMPIKFGTRRIVFFYYWDNTIPAHFLQFK